MNYIKNANSIFTMCSFTLEGLYDLCAYMLKSCLVHKTKNVGTSRSVADLTTLGQAFAQGKSFVFKITIVESCV
ncbi:MAG: hypothetical protein ACI9XB_002590 [Gammaproteobacteria bacterium]